MTIDYKKKTRQFTRTACDPFFTQFFNESDIELIIQTVFDNQVYVTNELFVNLLNNIVSYLGSFYPDVNARTPGKTDELKLIKKLHQHSAGLLEHLDILLNQYGYETWQHMNPFTLRSKDIRTRVSLDELYKSCQLLSTSLPITLQCIKNGSGKKTGNNSLQAIPGLIYYLIPIYEEVANKSVDENFHQDRKDGSLRYKGQFFDFIRAVLSIINAKYKQLYPNHKGTNPFKICLLESSIALGQHIQKTIKSIKEKHLKIKKERLGVSQ